MAAKLSEFVPKLVAKLSDDDAEVRCAAADALADVIDSVPGRDASVHLAKLCETDGSAEVRRACVEALGRLAASTLARHASSLVVALGHDSPSVRLAAATTLGHLTAADLAAHQSSLVQALVDPAVQTTVVQVLSAIEAACFVEQPAVLNLLEHEDAETRAAALTLLMRHEPTNLSADQLQMIAARLNDDDGQVRAAAVDALAALEPCSRHQCAADLFRSCNDAEEHVRAKAVGALGPLLATYPNWAEALSGKLAAGTASFDGDGNVRRAVIEALGMLGSAALSTHEAAVAALIGCLEDPASYVRSAAVGVLAEMDSSTMTEAQAGKLAKHVMGKCAARRAYEGKYAVCM